MTIYKIHPVTAMLHHRVAEAAKEWHAETILDMGGVGKLSAFIDAEIADANLNCGVDCCDLPYGDDQFDVCVSVATLEHVGNPIDFVRESVRVASRCAIHWFPYGERADKVERFKEAQVPGSAEELGLARRYNHPCTVLGPELIESLSEEGIECELSGFVTVAEHLLLLATLYPELNITPVYDYVERHGSKPYGTLLTATRDLKP
jgi:hypothetical protein